jgi:hypothetical protein
MTNRIMLAGTVVAKGNGKIDLETNELSFDGNETYTHTHPITMTQKDLKAVKKGSQIKVMGKFGRSEDRRGRIEALAVEPGYKGNDMNFGEVIGTAHRSFQFFEAKGDKRAFGNVLVRLDDGMILRGVCFAPTCHRFNGTCTTGSTVQVLGRIQHREYIDREGDQQIMIEIVGNDDFTNVLESVDLVNPFDVKEAEAI